MNPKPRGAARWIDPCTGRVWGSPNSLQLRQLAEQASRDEQAARAKTMTYHERWAARKTNYESPEWADDEKSREL